MKNIKYQERKEREILIRHWLCLDDNDENRKRRSIAMFIAKEKKKKKGEKIEAERPGFKCWSRFFEIVCYMSRLSDARERVYACVSVRVCVKREKYMIVVVVQA